MDSQYKAAQPQSSQSIKKFRRNVDKSVCQHDPNLWQQARMFIRNITSRYVNYSNQPISLFERDIHDLWYLLVETAKITPAYEATADRLAAQVIYARELGQLSRLILPSGRNTNEIHLAEEQLVQTEQAVTSTSERIWIDLPFLATDLHVAWSTSMIKLSSIELENLAGFTARLAALGVCTPRLCLCALMLFRNALEIPRPLVHSEARRPQEHSDHTPLSDFLPAMSVWLRWGSYKMFSLCAQSYVNLEDDYNGDEQWITAGKLFTAGAAQPLTGFTIARWEFWKGRLEEVSQSTEEDKTATAEQARICAHMMESWENITGAESHDRELARSVYFRTKTTSIP